MPLLFVAAGYYWGNSQGKYRLGRRALKFFWGKLAFSANVRFKWFRACPLLVSKWPKQTFKGTSGHDSFALIAVMRSTYSFADKLTFIG